MCCWLLFFLGGISVQYFIASCTGMEAEKSEVPPPSPRKGRGIVGRQKNTSKRLFALTFFNCYSSVWLHLFRLRLIAVLSIVVIPLIIFWCLLWFKFALGSCYICAILLFCRGNGSSSLTGKHVMHPWSSIIPTSGKVKLNKLLSTFIKEWYLTVVCHKFYIYHFTVILRQVVVF